MNHNKNRHRPKTKIKVKPYRVSRVNRLPGGRNHTKINRWHEHDTTTFSKRFLRQSELLWFRTRTPTATITLEYVQGHREMPQFKLGEWDGKAYFVRFPKTPSGSLYSDELFLFRITWWHNRA